MPLCFSKLLCYSKEKDPLILSAVAQGNIDSGFRKY